MAEQNRKALVSAPTSLPNRRDPQSVRRALTDRMTLSESIEIVGVMLKGYPNGQNVPNSYIGALADLIARYPRCVTHKAGDAMTGVPSITRFLPTPNDVVTWCEREVADLNGIVARDDRERAIQAEMKAREDETARVAAARAVRPTLQQMQEKHGPNWGIGERPKEDLQVKHEEDAKLRRANRVMFERECRAGGVDPNGMASPYLTRLIEEKMPVCQPARTEAAE